MSGDERGGGRRRVRGVGMPAWALPVLVILVYAAWAGVSVARQGRVLSRQVEAARATVPRPADLEAERVRGIVLARELSEVRSAMEPLRQELARLGSRWTNTAERLRGAEELARLWARHGLRLEEQQPVTGEAALTPPLQQLVDRARVVAGKGRHPILWEVRLRGGYIGMLGALEELARAEVAVVPLSLAMTSMEGRDDKEWRLRLWQ